MLNDVVNYGVLMCVSVLNMSGGGGAASGVSFPAGGGEKRVFLNTNNNAVR